MGRDLTVLAVRCNPGQEATRRRIGNVSLIELGDIEDLARVLAVVGADSIDGDAAAIVKWARDGGYLSFNKSHAQKAMEGRFRSVARLDKAIERLEQSDIAKVEKVPNRGARPTTNVRMNPKLFVD